MKKNWLATSICLIYVTLSITYYWNVPGDDLSSSYISCKLLVKGEVNHLYEHHPEFYHIVDDEVWVDTAQKSSFNGFLHPYVQTPLWIYVLKPLCGSMEFPVFNLLFLVLGFTSIAATVWITACLWAPQFIKNPLWLAGILFIFSLMIPTQRTAFLNQTNPIFLFTTLLAVSLALHERNILAGIVLAIAVSVKITPVLVAVYWLVTKRNRAVLSFFVSFFILVLITIALLGPDIYFAYIANLRRISDVLLVAFNNQSLAAWIGGVSAVQFDIFNWRMFPLPTNYKLLGYGFMGLTVAVLAMIKSRDLGKSERLEAVCISAIMIASTVFAPIAWTHYYIILIVPLIILFANGIETKKVWLLSCVCVIVLLNLYPISINPVTPHLYPVTIIRSHFFSGIICLIALLIDAYLLTSNSRKIEMLDLSRNPRDK